MKRLFICIACVLVMLGVISDLRTGSLPDKAQASITRSEATPNGSKNAKTLQNSEQTLESQEVIIEPGHTVLSIVEHLHQEPIPVSIEQMIDDFKELNQSLEPDAIQIGKTYLFPIYDKE